MSIHGTINGLPVTRVGTSAFFNVPHLVSITMPNTITNIGDSAFNGCTHLTRVYFKGNAPALGASVFSGDNNATVYYLPNTTGWTNNPWGGCPTVLWNPTVTADATFGIQADCFGFTFTNGGSPTVVVEACTNLTSPVWSPVTTNTLIGGSSSFGDHDWTNYPARFYRFQMP